MMRLVRRAMVFATALGLSEMVLAQTPGQVQANAQLGSQAQSVQGLKLPQQQAPVQAKIGTGLASQSLEAYLERVRTQASGERPEPGSIWSDNGRFTRMTTDVRAMRPHDLVSVVVSESLAASTDGR